MTHRGGTVATSDGGRLGYVAMGEGEPLVLVHRGGTDHRCWASVVPLLTDRFRVRHGDVGGAGGGAPPVRAVAPYEAPTGDPAVLPPGLCDEIHALLAAGDHGCAGRRFVTRTFFLPDRLVDRFEQGPRWPVLPATAPSLGVPER